MGCGEIQFSRFFHDCCLNLNGECKKGVMFMKKIFLISIISFLLCVPSISESKKIQTNDNNGIKVISANLCTVSCVLDSGEALMVRAVVFNVDEGVTFAKIVSGTCKGCTLRIEGNFKVEIGSYIVGYLYENKFAVISLEGGRQR